MKNVLVFGFLSLAAGTALQAQSLEQTLHGFCGTSYNTSTCNDNGVITPSNEDPLSPFGFTRSPDSNKNLTTPTFELVFLVPTTDTQPSFTAITGNNTGNTTETPSLFSATAWSSGDLVTNYLGLTQTGGPNNPIGAYDTAGVNPAGTQYDVYLANFGSVTFGTGTDPYFTDGFSIPTGTLILGLIEGSAANTVQDATANSAVLLEQPGAPTVPEPASVGLLGTSLVAVGYFLRKRVKSPSV